MYGTMSHGNSATNINQRISCVDDRDETTLDDIIGDDFADDEAVEVEYLDDEIIEVVDCISDLDFVGGKSLKSDGMTSDSYDINSNEKVHHAFIRPLQVFAKDKQSIDTGRKSTNGCGNSVAVELDVIPSIQRAREEEKKVSSIKFYRTM